MVNVECKRIRKFREAKQTKTPYTSPAKKRTNILVFILEDLFVSTYVNTYLCMYSGLPRWHSGKDSACQRRRRKRLGFSPWFEKTPWRRKWQPTPVFVPGKSHGQRSLADYSPWGCKESDTTEHTHTHTHTRTRTHVFLYWQQSNKVDKIIPVFQMKEEEMQSTRCLLFCSRSHHWGVPGC